MNAGRGLQNRRLSPTPVCCVCAWGIRKTRAGMGADGGDTLVSCAQARLLKTVRKVLPRPGLLIRWQASIRAWFICLWLLGSTPASTFIMHVHVSYKKLRHTHVLIRARAGHTPHRASSDTPLTGNSGAK